MLISSFIDSPSRWRFAAFAFANLTCLLPIASGCWSGSPANEVVVYAALDSEFSKPVFADFQKQTGIAVLPKFDAESAKTIGLVTDLMAEADHPRCDVFWNNETINTLRLEERGLLASYRSPAAKEYPEIFRSPEGLWYGFAARARVIVVNTDLVAEADRPKSIEDLTAERWRGQIGMAKPLFGTTATHAACLFAYWGDERAEDYFERLKANDVRIMSGNRQVAQAVAGGQLAFGLTDTDDAIGELEAGKPLAIVYPDQQEDGVGTLFIPNTLAILKNCPHPAAARKLVDYLLSPAVEAKLAEGPSAQIPLNPAVEAKTRIETPKTVRAMQVDFKAAAAKWDQAAKFLRDRFAAAD
jgi:iron(III) transport system substrate-binding protein